MITSLRNAHVERARKLRKRGVRDRTRELLVEGFTSIGEALAAGVPVDLVFAEPHARGRAEALAAEAGFEGRVLEVSPQVMRAISDATTPPGAVAIASHTDRDVLRLLEQPVTLGLALAGVRDPGNLGTMFRTAWAVGAEAAFLGSGTVDAYNPKVVRAAAGSVFRLPFAREVALPWVLHELGNRGVQRIAADPRAPAAYDGIDMTAPTVLVVGNEAWGLAPEVAGEVDLRAAIPMRGSADSLNVAVSAAIFLFEAARQRRRR